MLALTALIVLLGVAAMLVIAGQIAQDRLDDRVDDVNKEFDKSLNQFRADVRKELDARLPPTGTTPVPTVTPPPTETTPPPTETPSGDATESPTASPTESPSPSPTETITP
jgi:hypothetical protein